MSLLSPFFLAGLALIAGPIIAHLIRRATKDRIEFSALRFLAPSAPRLDRRSRIQHPLLLLLRCLIIATLTLAFARPYWTQTAPPVASDTNPKIVVVLLDRSASMQRDNLWDEGIARIETMVDQLAPSDVFALIAFDGRTQTLISGEQWQQALPAERSGLVSSTLATQSPGWNATYLDNGVATALEAVRELNELIGGSSGSELVIISDFTTGARVAGLAGLDWPDHTVVKLDPVTASSSSHNFALQWLGWGADSGQGAPARVRIVGPPPAVPRQISVRLVDAKTDQAWGDPVATVMPTTGTQLLALPVGNDAPAALRIELLDRRSDFGRSLFVVRNLTRTIQFKVWGETSANNTSDSRFYLESAVKGWRDPQALMAGETGSSPSALLVLTQPPSEADLRELRSQLESGAFVLVLANSPQLVSAAGALAGESEWRSETAPNARPLLFGNIDFGHPLFASFADPRFSDFTRIRFTKTTPIKLPDDTRTQVVAHFDNGQPAVLESEVGEGRLIVWASSWAPRDSQWVLSTKFVPWLQAVAERAVGGTAPVTVTDLGNLARLALSEETAINRLNSIGSDPVTLDRPGIYQLTERSAPSRLIGLNVPSSETDFEPMTWDTFEDLGVPLGHAIPLAVSTETNSGELPESALASEGRQRAWRWFILTAVALLIAEGAFSLLLNRRTTGTPVATTP